MTDEKDDKISALFAAAQEPDDDASSDRLARAMKRVRASVGQRDSLLFAFVKIWTAIAEMLAPIFAQLGERRAANAARSRRLPTPTTKSPSSSDNKTP